MKNDNPRRLAICQLCTAAVALPVMMMASRPAFGAKVEAMRTALKYQPEPKDGQRCSDCIHYKGDPADGSQGTCAIIPGDTEIDATGWCTGFAKKSG